MLTLYGVYRSRAVRNLWLLEETGLPFTHRPVVQAYRLPDPAAPDAPLNTRSPAFLAITSAGAVPCLTDGDLVLTESLGINLYLAQKAGGPLAPASPAESALMLQWALYSVSSIEKPAVELMFLYRDGKAASPEGQAALATQTAALQRPLAVLDQHLATQGHMVGGRFTVADINMAEVVRYATSHPPALAPFPAVTAWLTACQARPAFRKIWAIREAEPE